MLRSLRRARGLEWLVIELHRAAHDLERLAVVAFEFDQHVVGERLLVGGEVLQALDRRPLTLHRLQMLPPVREWLGSDRLDDQIAGSAGGLDQFEIGRASCRERECQYGKLSEGAESLKKKYIHNITHNHSDTHL